MIQRSTLVLFAAALPCLMLGQEDESDSVFKKETPAEKVESTDSKAGAGSKDVTVGTKSYDAGRVQELFKELEAENKLRVEQQAPHLDSDNMEVIELQARHVSAYELPGYNELVDKIDPRPRQQLERLAALDPAAAADIKVTRRAEERFFAGEEDMTFDSNAGRVATVDLRKVGASLNDAIKKVNQNLEGKKVTDDQGDVPDSER